MRGVRNLGEIQGSNFSSIAGFGFNLVPQFENPKGEWNKGQFKNNVEDEKRLRLTIGEVANQPADKPKSSSRN